MFLYYFLYTINTLLMLVPPIILGILIARKRGMSWGIFGAGAVTFILSQVGHIPFNSLVREGWGLDNFLFQLPGDIGLIGIAIFLGLSSGVFEEVARYLTLRYWRKDVRTWGSGMMLGAGHGGIEAIIVGINFAATFIVLSAYDAGLMPNLLASVPAEELAASESFIQQQIAALANIPWYGRVLGGVERVFAVTLHLSLSLMVMHCFTQGKRRWLLLAIGWHALANAGAIIIIGLTNEYLAELFIGLMALGSLLIIRHFKQPEPVEPEPEPLPPLKSVDLSKIEPTSDNLESSRYV
jgi:uncharacterized membrane protein YhfC